MELKDKDQHLTEERTAMFLDTYNGILFFLIKTILDNKISISADRKDKRAGNKLAVNHSNIRKRDKCGMT